MGFFNFGKNKDTKETNHTSWESCHKAQPNMYEKDGKRYMFFTLKEGVDTVLCLQPAEVYSVDKPEEVEYRLLLLSTTEDTLIGNLPFYKSVRFLKDYVVEDKFPLVLLRGLTLEDMKIFVQNMEVALQEEQTIREICEQTDELLQAETIAPETVEAVFHSRHVKTYTFEQVYFPSGTLIAADPICELQSMYVPVIKETIPSGYYPITIGILDSELVGIRMTGMCLKVTEEEALSYQAATMYKAKDKKEFRAAFPVDAGMSTFCDKEAAESYWKVLYAWFIESKEFLPDSYTRYTNKIGLTHNGDFISKANDIVLDFPYKDCVLEGGQDKDDQKRKEIFYNETIASDEITKMLAPKVFTKATKYSAEGVEPVTKYSDEDNLIIKGNNLIVLSSLLKRFEGKVKCIYIEKKIKELIHKSTLYITQSA